MIVYALIILLTLLYASNWNVKRMLRFMGSPAFNGETVSFECHAVAFLIDIFIIACILIDMIQEIL